MSTPHLRLRPHLENSETEQQLSSMADLGRKERLRIHDLICKDPVALEKWGMVANHHLTDELDVIRIKDLLDRSKHAEAVLETLQLNCDLTGLLQALRGQGLKALADRVEAERFGSTSASDHVWHDVGELPHDFSGRDSELETTHQRLSHHSNWSVDANIVCISGPAGVGKSTLARRYAFDNCDFYGGNVMWIDAESTEPMRASFTKLATTKLLLPADEDNQTLAEDVYGFFKDRKCLFVFDGLQRMEDFNQFRPKIISPLYSTPYLLVTSRKGGLAPAPQNEIRMSHWNTVGEELTNAVAVRVQAEPTADSVQQWAERVPTQESKSKPDNSRLKLTKGMIHVMRHADNIPMLLAHLFSQGVITDDDKERIEARVTKADKMEALMMMLCRRGPHTFDKLQTALMESANEHVKRMLDNVSTNEDASSEQVETETNAAGQTKSKIEGTHRVADFNGWERETLGAGHESKAGPVRRSKAPTVPQPVSTSPTSLVEQVTRPLQYSTPYLLVTSREGELTPERENELRILHYRVAMSKPAAELAKLISYLDPGKVTIRFLGEVFEQFKTSGRDFQSCLRLLEKHNLVQVSESRVTIEPGVQEIIRSSLSEEEEVSSLRTIRETHQHLIEKRTEDLVDECTAHRLHLLHLDLKSASLARYFDRLWFDLLDYSDHSSLLKVSRQAYEILIVDSIVESGSNSGSSSARTDAKVKSEAPASAAADSSSSGSSKGNSSSSAATPAIKLDDLQKILSNIQPASPTAVDLSAGVSNELIQRITSNPGTVKKLAPLLPNFGGPQVDSTTGEETSESREVADTLTSPQFHSAVRAFCAAFPTGQLGPLVAEFKMGKAAVEAAEAGNLEAFINSIQQAADSQAPAAAPAPKDEPEDMNID